MKTGKLFTTGLTKLCFMIDGQQIFLSLRLLKNYLLKDIMLEIFKAVSSMDSFQPFTFYLGCKMLSIRSRVLLSFIKMQFWKLCLQAEILIQTLALFQAYLGLLLELAKLKLLSHLNINRKSLNNKKELIIKLFKAISKSF